MKLIFCHVENFGKLHDLQIHFTDSLTTICEENGWGKSTLCSFIKVMFYGFEGEHKRKEQDNERRRFWPWQGGIYGGTICFEVNGKQYLLNRIFHEKASSDEFELRDYRTNMISKDYSENIGEELFGIDSLSFQKTIFMDINACDIAVTDDIHAKVAEQAEDITGMRQYENAVQILTRTMNRLNPNRVTGSISRRENQIGRLKVQIPDEAMLHRQIENCKKRIQEAEYEYEEQKQLRLNSMKRELPAVSREFIYKQEHSDKNNALLLLTGVSALLLVLGFVLLFITDTAYCLLVSALGIVLFAVGIQRMNRKQTDEDEQQHQNEPYDQYDQFHQYEAILDQMEKLKESIADAKRELYLLQEKLQEREEIAIQLQELTDLQEKEQNAYRYASLAREKICQARENITTKYGKPLEERFRYYYQKISGQVDDRIHIDASASVMMKESGKMRDVSLFSTGSQDLIGICMRFALADVMYQNEKPFLIMDDPFVNLDDSRLPNALNALKVLSEEYQILYFSCSKNRI